MKKLCVFLLNLIVIALLLTSCGPKTQSTNTIRPMKLTAEQQEIVELLTNSQSYFQETLLFEISINEEYKSFEAWIEVYEKGILVESNISFVAQLADKPEVFSTKQLAIVINKTSPYQWSFTLNDESSQSSYTATSALVPADTDLGNAFWPISQPIKIEKNKEIVLYSSLFTQGGNSTKDEQDFIDNTDLLVPYEHSYLIKCKFA